MTPDWKQAGRARQVSTQSRHLESLLAGIFIHDLALPPSRRVDPERGRYRMDSGVQRRPDDAARRPHGAEQPSSRRVQADVFTGKQPAGRSGRQAGRHAGIFPVAYAHGPEVVFETVAELALNLKDVLLPRMNIWISPRLPLTGKALYSRKKI